MVGRSVWVTRTLFMVLVIAAVPTTFASTQVLLGSVAPMLIEDTPGGMMFVFVQLPPDPLDTDDTYSVREGSIRVDDTGYESRVTVVEPIKPGATDVRVLVPVQRAVSTFEVRVMFYATGGTEPGEWTQTVDVVVPAGREAYVHMLLDDGGLHVPHITDLTAPPAQGGWILQAWLGLAFPALLTGLAATAWTGAPMGRTMWWVPLGILGALLPLAPAWPAWILMAGLAGGCTYGWWASVSRTPSANTEPPVAFDKE